jgi:hypothetical protein
LINFRLIYRLKSFTMPSIWEVRESDRQLYLAIPLETYETFFQSRFAQTAIERHDLRLIIYNPISEEIVQWII